jgi:hypothetical protein
LPPGYFDTVFTRQAPIFSSKFMGCGSIVDAMNTTLLRSREMSLALIVIAVVNHGHLEANYSGDQPGSSGLMRLGRDLMRRAGAEKTAEVAAAESIAPLNRRSRLNKP